jgi:hypothetical protein
MRCDDDRIQVSRETNQYLQNHVGDPIRLAYDGRCDDLVKKLESLKKAKEHVSTLCHLNLIDRRANFYLHRALQRAEHIAFYSYHMMGDDMQKLFSKDLEAARKIRANRYKKRG